MAGLLRLGEDMRDDDDSVSRVVCMAVVPRLSLCAYFQLLGLVYTMRVLSGGLLHKCTDTVFLWTQKLGEAGGADLRVVGGKLSWP